MLQRLFRLASLSAIRASGPVARLGSEKLVVIPLALGILGVHEVGRVLLALAWTRAIIVFPFSAINIGLLRMHAGATKREEWPNLLACGIVGGAGSGLTLGLLFWLVHALLMPAETGVGYSSMLLALGLGALVAEVRLTSTADLRLKLRFGIVSWIDLLEGLLLLSAVPLAWRFGTSGLVAAFVLAPLPGLFVAVALVRSTLVRATRSWVSWLRPLARVSLGFVGVAAIGQVLYQVARLVVGWLEGPEAVAVFFAAEASVVLLLMPMHFLGNVLFTLLARKGSAEEVGKQAVRQHLIATLVAAVGFWSAAIHVAPFVVRLLYDEVAAQAVPLVGILVPGAAFRLLFMSSLPFYFRFAAMRTIVGLSLASLVVSMALVVALTATGGLHGAALGVTLGNVVMGLSWFAIHAFMSWRSRWPSGVV